MTIDSSAGFLGNAKRSNANVLMRLSTNARQPPKNKMDFGRACRFALRNRNRGGDDVADV